MGVLWKGRQPFVCLDFSWFDHETRLGCYLWLIFIFFLVKGLVQLGFDSPENSMFLDYFVVK